MDKMSYKTFVWPQNPHTYQEEGKREVHYATVDREVYYTGVGPVQRVITGSGVFYGETAFADYRRLEALFEDTSPGNLEHPVWGIRYCYFTGLELTQEPRDNYISYTFRFTQAQTNGEVPK